MEEYEIIGGVPLRGKILVAGSKNVALKVIIASLLTREKIVLRNIPDLSDLRVLYELIASFGAKLKRHHKTVTIEAKNLSPFNISIEKSKKLRASYMLIAPLLTRFDEVRIPNPGGDKIGARPIDRSLNGLKHLGASIKECDEGYICAVRNGLRGITHRFEKNTHTGTETLILAAALAKGKTVLENAACEPEVDDLIRFLNSLGANIKRVKERTIVINGVSKLHGGSYKIMPDRNEVVTFAIAAYVTKGDIFIPNAQKEYLTSFLAKLEEANCKWQERRKGLQFTHSVLPKATKLTTMPHPGFMTDWQGPWTLLMTQAKGNSITHETIYEDRFGYVGQLQKMGARISLFNPEIKNPEKLYNFNRTDNKNGSFHAVKISGPTMLTGTNLTIPDLRAGATLVLAALSAKGKSTLTGVEHIDRGYEDFDIRLKKLGAKIKRETI